MTAKFLACVLSGTLAMTVVLAACAAQNSAPAAPAAPVASPEVRGTWLTTTANTAIAGPAESAASMKALAEMGLNTVYVETWKNGYTQYPSKVLQRTIGVDRRPALMKSDPSDDPSKIKEPGRDLLEETLIEAHRNGLLYIAWFEYGFMAAHKDTDNHLRRMKQEWLSRDQKGNEVAPNGFVWMNPLHPEARRFVLDLVLEAVDNYDLDGVQLDDRIVWPYYTMGYDDYTKKIYAQEHNGATPPTDPKDEAWMRWRADKVNESAKKFVQEVRAARPGLIVSLSPAPYPWCYENYLLEWPKWGAWTGKDSLSVSEPNWKGAGVAPRWDEFIPQCYRYNYKAFEGTWNQQIEMLRKYNAADRVKDMLAGILILGSEPNPVPWADLERSVDLVRKTGGGGHVWWFSKGVLEVYPSQVAKLYDVQRRGRAPHPDRPMDWRSRSIVMTAGADGTWSAENVPSGTWRAIVRRDGRWSYAANPVMVSGNRASAKVDGAEAVELLRDRRPEMRSVVGN